ncbi:hypothetical protein ACFLWR_00365 [Chloroflexota bacterium]
MERYYSIHDIVTFKVVGKISRRMAMEYRNFESEVADKLDFTVYLENFTPVRKGCQLLDGNHWVRDDYLYCEDSYKLAKWKLELTGFDSDNIIARLHTNAVGSVYADMFVCAYNIDHLIRFVLNSKGYTAVHAAAVSKDGHGLLFPAQSGVGKTTTAAYFTQAGYDFLGDDFVIIGNGRVLSFLTPLNIFSYNLSPVIKNNVGAAGNITLALKNIIYRVSAGYIKIFSKLNPKDAFLTCQESELRTVFFLTQGDKFGINTMERADLIEHLFINYEMESSPFYGYILEYAYAFPESKVAAYWKNYKANLNRNLPDDLPIYRVEVPRRYDRETFENILNVVG